MSTPSPVDASLELRTIWEDYRPTRLVGYPRLARLAGVGKVFVKAEWERPLGNFKALGGMVAGLRALARVAGVASLHDLAHAARAGLPRLICASDGNHGLAVTAAARRAGTGASIHLPRSASQARADRIRALGGDVVWVAGTYDDAIDAAAAAASRGEGLLVPDTSDDPHDRVVEDVMTGYALMTGEIVSQLKDGAHRGPSHVFVQAGVGGLAAAMAEGLRDCMRAPNALLVVEPESAACVARALVAGRPVRIEGDFHTSAGMLACGTASAAAVEILRRCNARSVLVDESQLHGAVETLRQIADVRTTPSGAAGFAGLLQVASQPELRAAHALGADSEILLVITEGPLDEDRSSSSQAPIKGGRGG